MSEIWKTAVVDGVENPRYQVSNLGRVKCIEYGRWSKCERELSVYLVRGYYHVNIDRKQMQVHRLVANAFIPNPENKPCIDHINTVRTDNRVENLRWVTYKENCNNPITRKHMSESKKGEKHHYYGLCSKDIPTSKKIVQLSKDGFFVAYWDSIKDAGISLGISKGHICQCCKGKRNHTGGFKWMYATDYVPVRRSISEIRPLF